MCVGRVLRAKEASKKKKNMIVLELKFHQIIEAAGKSTKAKALLAEEKKEALEKATPGARSDPRLEPGLCPPHQHEVRIDPGVSQV